MRSDVPINLVSTIKARKLLKKGCQGYLAQVVNREAKPVELQQILVVKKFSDVFPGELPRLPPRKGD